MFSKTSRRPLRAALLSVSLLIAAAGCASDASDDTASGPEPTEANAATTTTVPCEGAPIKLMQIASLEGGVSWPQAADGTKAAVATVNATCELGRPLELIVCDDRFDPNVALECGRQAVDEGVLSLVNSFSLVADGGIQIATAAGIPHFGNPGVSTVDATDPLSFPLGSGLTMVLGEVSAAAGLGKEQVVLVGPQSPTVEFLVSQVEAHAGRVDIDFGGWISYESGVTDFAPIVAQVTASGADAAVFLLSDPEVQPVVQAIASEGIDLADTAVFMPGPSASQADVDELGDGVEGLYFGDYGWPASDRDNEGVAAMADAVAATGADTSDLTSAQVGGWTAIHVLVDVLKGADDIDAIDSAALVDLLSKATVTDRPEWTPVDWTAPAFPDAPLNALRVFTNRALITRVVEGKITVVSDGFADVNEPVTTEGP